MYKTILVHLDQSHALEDRVELAVRLAARFDAHLVGLLTQMPWSVPVYAEIPIGAEVINQAEAALAETADRIVSLFEAHAASAGISHESRVEEGGASQLIIAHGRYSDLIILGQRDPDDDFPPDSGVANAVLLESGRPCLIVPYIGAPESCGERILAAWNGGREAARAFSDAAPFMQEAREVTVFVANPKETVRAEGPLPGADIAVVLSRQGIKAEVNTVTVDDIDVGNEMLSHAFDTDIDLIVMGAYGHSRFRELVLGGATRFLLKHMTVPVLMAH